MSAPACDSRVHTIGLTGRDCAHFWLFNFESAWTTKGVRGVSPSDIRGAAIELPDLASGTYHVE